MDTTEATSHPHSHDPEWETSNFHLHWKVRIWGTSLEVQWSKIHTSSAGRVDLIPGWDPTFCMAWPKKKGNCIFFQRWPPIHLCRLLMPQNLDLSLISSQISFLVAVPLEDLFSSGSPARFSLLRPIAMFQLDLGISTLLHKKPC